MVAASSVAPFATASQVASFEAALLDMPVVSSVGPFEAASQVASFEAAPQDILAAS